jgi:hypothetical protein
MRHRSFSLVPAIIISLLAASGVVSAAQQTPKRGAADIRGIVPSGAGSFTWNAEDWWVDR